MRSPQRVTIALVLAALGAVALLTVASEPDSQRGRGLEGRPRSEPERVGGDGDAEADDGAIQQVPAVSEDRPDGRAEVDGLAGGATDAGPGAPAPAAPSMRDVEIVRAGVEARFAGASADMLEEALRDALRGGANAAAQAALRAHLEAVHAARLEAGEYEVMDAAALERIGARDLRWSLQPTLFNGQYALHVLPDGRDVRTEVRPADFAGADVDFELAIETVWIEKLYADALRSE